MLGKKDEKFRGHHEHDIQSDFGMRGIVMPYRDYQKRREWFNKRRKERMDFLRDYKRKIGRCVKCGWGEHPELLQPHHRNPSDKKFKFGKGNIGNLRIERILEELKKCDLLCPNCHLWIHFKKYFD